MINIKKEDLRKYYVDEKKTILEISKVYECSCYIINTKLKKYGISVKKEVKEKNDIWAKENGYENIDDYYENVDKYYKRGIATGSSTTNKKCSAYLGIHICENKKFLSKVINIIESMKCNNPGYDVICGKGKKIDVKCACLSKNNTWIFTIKKNKIADYFLIISFDNRESLNVQHIWLVKGDSVIEKTTYNSKEFIFNEKNSVIISKGNKALKRWIKHEITDIYKLKEVQKVCDKFKNDNKYNI